MTAAANRREVLGIVPRESGNIEAGFHSLVDEPVHLRPAESTDLVILVDNSEDYTLNLEVGQGTASEVELFPDFGPRAPGLSRYRSRML